MTTLKLIFVFLLLISSAFAQIAITNVSVIPMDHNEVLKNQTVLVEGDKITAVGPAKSAKIPPGAQIINGHGKFLIPGLVDSHVHLLSPDQLPLYVANGVTTVFNLEGRRAHLSWRKQVADGKLVGPTIFTAGPIFFGSRTVETGVKTVDQQAEAGYDAFKVFNQVSAEVYPAVAAEAKQKKLLLIGHIPRGVGAEAAVEAGQSVAHADEFLYTYFNPKRTEDVQQDNVQHVVVDEIRIPELARRVRLANVIVETTLVTDRDGIEEATNLDHFLATKPELKYLAPWVLDTISPARNRFKAAYKPADYPALRQTYPFEQKIVRALHEIGVPLLAGTDATDSGPVAGFGLHDELEELTKCGLSEYEALKAATVNPASYLRNAPSYTQDFGTIQAGKRADLVLLGANPLQKISNTRRIEAVMMRGQWFDKQKTDAMLNQLRGTYAQEMSDFVRNLEQDPKQAAAFAAENDPFHGMSNYLFGNLIEARHTTGFRALVDTIRKQDPESPFVTEAAINQLGYTLLQGGRKNEALAAFEVNTLEYPQSANTFDSLGETQFANGDVKSALASYRHALELDANYVNAEFAKKFVAAHQ